MSSRKEIKDAADILASDAWLDRELPGELERVNEIRRLTVEQLNEDTYSTAGSHRDRIGDGRYGYVQHYGGNEFGELLWPERTEDQLALEKGFEPFLDGLPAEIRPFVRMHYDARMTEQEIADVTGIPKSTIHRRIVEIQTLLRKSLTQELLKMEENKDV